jgi:hypothetical protein
MDCSVRVYFGRIVRKEDGEFEDMEEELEWFDELPSFNDLCVRLNTKFGGNFTIKGRFDSGKTRTKYVLMPLCDPAHWSRYTRVLAGSNSSIAEVVVENGYRLEDNHHDNSQIVTKERNFLQPKFVLAKLAIQLMISKSSQDNSQMLFMIPLIL